MAAVTVIFYSSRLNFLIVLTHPVLVRFDLPLIKMSNSFIRQQPAQINIKSMDPTDKIRFRALIASSATV